MSSLSKIKKGEIMELEKSIIDKQSRTTTSINYDYGKNQSEGTVAVDIPEKAEIAYNKHDDLIYEDYSKLDEFLEKEFIPANVTMRKKVKSQDTEGRIYPFIQLSAIVKLRLSELETKHVMEYLSENGIYVRGINSTIDEEFENYDYYRTYRSAILPETLSEDDQLQKFALYYQTKDPVLREQLIIANMRLASYIAYKMSVAYGIDIHELVGYGYEGLIEAVDRFNPTYGHKFSSYAYKYIKGYILKGISELQGIDKAYWFAGFLKAKRQVEIAGTTLESNPELAYQIVDIMVKDGAISPKNAQDFPQFLEMSFCKKILTEEELAADDEEKNPENMAINANLKELMMKVLDTLDPREKRILELRFGFGNNNPLSREEIAQELGISVTRIRQIESQAIKKLRHPRNSSKLRSFSENYSEPKEHNYPQQPRTYLDDMLEKHTNQSR